MKTKRLSFLFLAIIFSGCAISIPVKKTGLVENGVVVCSAGATPLSMTYLFEKDKRKFIDPNYGTVYAPSGTDEWEFRGEISYVQAQVYNRLVQYGLAGYYRLHGIDNGINDIKNYSVAGNISGDRRYYAALEPRETIEPFIGSYFLSKEFYLRIDAGLPLTFFSWEKYYSERLNGINDHWAINPVENNKIGLWPGLSGKIAVGHNGRFNYPDYIPCGFVGEIRYSPLKLNGRWVNNLTWSAYAEIDFIPSIFLF